MDVNSFQKMLVDILSSSDNELIKNVAENEKNISITCTNNKEFSISLHKSTFHESLGHTSLNTNLDDFKKSVEKIYDKDPFLVRILITMLNLMQMDIITTATFINIMEGVITNFQSQ